MSYFAFVTVYGNLQSYLSRGLLGNLQSYLSRGLLSNLQSYLSTRLLSNLQSYLSRGLLSNLQSYLSRGLLSNLQSYLTKVALGVDFPTIAFRWAVNLQRLEGILRYFFSSETEEVVSIFFTAAVGIAEGQF